MQAELQRAPCGLLRLMIPFHGCVSLSVMSCGSAVHKKLNDRGPIWDGDSRGPEA